MDGWAQPGSPALSSPRLLPSLQAPLAALPPSLRHLSSLAVAVPQEAMCRLHNGIGSQGAGGSMWAQEDDTTDSARPQWLRRCLQQPGRQWRRKQLEVPCL